MSRRIWKKEELETTFRVNSEGLLERLFKRKGWCIINCRANDAYGYCIVQFKGSMIKYHTLIWILINGSIEDVDAELDHANGDKLDNRIENLRLVSKRENQQNRIKHRAGRLQGCCLDKKWNKWQAHIVINKKQVGLGLYNTELEAHNVYIRACELIEKYIDNAQFRALVKGA